ncbi:MAG: diguanylate cyclase [Nitrospinaceae bacterium]
MQKHSILLVEDDKDSALDISESLKGEGYQVVLVHSGEEGLRKLKKSPFDILITDLKLGAMDGLEVLQSVQEISPDTSVLILTGYGSLDSSISALRSGASDYLLKPCGPYELLLRIKNCLEVRELRKNLKQHTAELENANKLLRHEIMERKRAEEELSESRKQLIEHNQVLQQLSVIDGMTGIFNRRYFDDFLEKESGRAARDKSSLALIMVDVDCFKAYNDLYGHQAGDECLRQIASCLTRTMQRSADLVARYGGEEFAVILPGNNVAGAFRVAEAMRKNVESLSIVHEQSTTGNLVTISLGVSGFNPGKEFDHNAILGLADKALYEAKNKGRNRVDSIQPA